MKLSKVFFFFLVLSLSACSSNHQKENTLASKPLKPQKKMILVVEPEKKEGNTIESRFPTPSGFERVDVLETSFGAFLRQLPLKPEGASVRYYDGSTKTNNNVYLAVADQEIGNKDLHQCADAIIRLRAEYLWKHKKYEDIQFNLTNGFTVRYSEWMKGKRVAVDGNRTYWVNKTSPSNTYQDFWKYLEFVFMYAGTASLEKELHAQSAADIAIGDVFIQGGFPGHAILVVDKAANPETGEILIMLGQSYMPAQQFQILVNPNNPKSPWYKVNARAVLYTPEWDFEYTNLKSW